MERALAEKLSTRKNLIEIINAKPGIHFRELLNESGLAMGELEYHLNVLEKMEIVSKSKSTYYSRYYPAYELSSEDKQIMGLLRQEILRDILLFIISRKKTNHGDISKEFRLLKSTASFYLDKLLNQDLIEKHKRGRRVFYNVKAPEHILKLILLYRKGFGEEIITRVEGLWGNL